MGRFRALHRHDPDPASPGDRAALARITESLALRDAAADPEEDEGA